MNRTSLFAALSFASVALADPVGSAFTYQGRLTDAGSPASGVVDPNDPRDASLRTSKRTRDSLKAAAAGMGRPLYDVTNEAIEVSGSTEACSAGSGAPSRSRAQERLSDLVAVHRIITANSLNFSPGPNSWAAKLAIGSARCSGQDHSK